MPVRRITAGALGLGLAVAGLQLVSLPVASASEAGDAVIIKEVYGGGGSTSASAAYKADFVELYNPTAEPLSLNGLSLQYRSGTYSGSGSVSVLALPNETVAAKDHFLVRVSSNMCSNNTVLCGGAEVPSPDFSGTALNMAAGSGQVMLVTGTTTVTTIGTSMHTVANVVDFVGYGTASSSETASTGTALDNTKSVQRKTATDSNNNNQDFEVLAPPTPTASTPDETAPVVVADPGDKTARVGQEIAPINLQATGGVAPYTWEATGLPAGLQVSGSQITGTPTADGTFEVTLTATDSDTPPVSDTETFTITVAPALAVTPIHEVQGTGATTPMANQDVLVEGVVTAAYPTGGFNGFYVQTAGTGGATDTTPKASDAIFVWGGSAGFAPYPELGASVRVSGRAVEGGGPATGLTQITNASWTTLETPLAAVSPLAIAYPTTAAGREAQEGMLLAPTDTFTVTNAYSANQFAEIGLATGTTPLRQPTDFVDDDDAAGLQAIKDDNAARAVAIDDGASTNYMNGTARNRPLPYLTSADGTPNAVRVGARATLQAPVILEYRNNVWKFQPRTQVTTNGADVVTFEDTRDENVLPQDVGGDLKLATFNVLNYFNTTGEAYDAVTNDRGTPVDTRCVYYNDRENKPIGNDKCGLYDPTQDKGNDGRGPRGAATAESLARQEAKMVTALTSLGADIVALEEVENSIKLPSETNRDDAVARVVQILNDSAGAGTWAYVRSPGEATTAAAVAEQDVIRNAIIYKTATVEPVGQSDILFGTTEFANAREPLAQAFKRKGAPDSDAFAVIVNHFKSKGDNASPVPPATGDNVNSPDTGAFNGDRTRQAARLAQFAEDFAEDRGVEAVFLAGDFNSYAHEDPITVLEDAGYELVESDQPGDESYSFSGLSGSLDHILGNAAAVAMVTGADVWEINANESVAFQYSRFNYNVTDFWQPNLPFATSDHNPHLVGVDVPESTPVSYKEIQVLGTNDFHGRLLADGGNAAGAAEFATAVKELKAQYPEGNSIFVAAGDLIGASTFESFVLKDKPTIDALNAAGLEVSAVGNHELDGGYDDLVNRVMNHEHAHGGAKWEYIAANLQEPEGKDEIAETWTKTIDGVKVGFVGAVTEDLASLVAPGGIQGVTVTDVVEATDAAAAALKADGAEVVILLVHEGAPSTECASAAFTDEGTAFGNIAQNVSADVDAIISGHTHLAYNCKFTVPEWVDQGRAVTKRPVVSAGQYGTNLNKLVFKFDQTSGDLAALTQDVVATAGVGYAPDPAVKQIVDQAVAEANVIGAQVLGKIAGGFNRARYNAPQLGSTENRGGESTLSNLVAEVQRWATQLPETGIEADIAFMNPGGLRADMPGTGTGATRDLTYRQAADVQPFANTLVNMDLTGAQIETVLEQQWQRNAQGGVPSRPFLRLGVSKGFTYTYVETPERVTAPNSAPVDTFRGEVTGMWLKGEPIDPEATYSVTVNSFLGSGGDNFWELANGANKVDTGKVDLEAMVAYMDRFDTSALPVDYSQRAVEVTFPPTAPATYAPGGTVSFDVASWAMTAPGDAQDTELLVKLGTTTLATVPVDNTVGSAPYDDYGKAHVDVQLPETMADGTRRLRLVGATTGTSVPVAITVQDGDTLTDVQIIATNDFHGRLTRNGGGPEAGAAVLAGAVKQLREENPQTVFAAAGDLIGASTFESFIQHDKPTIDALNEAGLDVSAVGNHEFDQGYSDLVQRVMAPYDAETNPLGGARWKYVGANVVMRDSGAPALDPSWIKDFGDVEVGFVGAVTEELHSLVSPQGIAAIEVTPIVEAVNEEAESLKTAGADIVVLLVHEGAATSNIADATDDSPFGRIVTGAGPEVDAIVSGHTHRAYNHSVPVPAWVTEGRDVTERPVVSAGQYGSALNKLVFTVDTATGEVVTKTQDVLDLQRCTAGCSGSSQTWVANYDADAATADIVADAVAKADVLGAVPLGEIGGAFNRARLSTGAENRGGESTLGNLVADVQRWATSGPESGTAQIAFMNPGGLRADMTGNGTGDFPRTLTYKQAAVVQPFANTLVNMDLTGAQIEAVLEQQWQPSGASRPFLKLGVSEGFTYTYDPSAPAGERITGMWLHGEPVDASATYSVTANSFLAGGGDNFTAFNQGTNKADTGKVDLAAMVDYMAAAEEPVSPDFAQRAVGVRFPAEAPDAYAPGGEVAFHLSSLAFTHGIDRKDDQVQVFLGETALGSAPVDNTVGTAGSDEYGTADVSVSLPASVPAGDHLLTVIGATTGTRLVVPIRVTAVLDLTVDDVTSQWGETVWVEVTASGNGGVPGGTVELIQGETPRGSAVLDQFGRAEIGIAPGTLPVGEHPMRLTYSGDDVYGEQSDSFIVTVTKAEPVVTADDLAVTYPKIGAVEVRVDGPSLATEGSAVQVLDGSSAIASAPVTSGTAYVTLPKLKPGTYRLTARVVGTESMKEASDPFTVTVAKAKSSR